MSVQHLTEKLREALENLPESGIVKFELLECTYAFRDSYLPAMAPYSGHSRPLHFLIKKVAGKTIIQCKRWDFGPFLPKDGHKLLVGKPGPLEVSPFLDVGTLGLKKFVRYGDNEIVSLATFM